MVYDLIIIGGGPAGYYAAEIAGKAGMKTLLIEASSLGGVCLNEGCIPTKTLLKSAKLYDSARNGEKYGVYVEGARLNHEDVIKRKDKVVGTLVSGIKSSLKKYGVETVEGFGKVTGRTAEGFGVDVSGIQYTGKRLLIATGSKPAVPPIRGIKEGLERGFVLTSREILSLVSVPETLVVIGAGAVGLEIASYYNSAGSKVHVIEMLDHIAGNVDMDISKLLYKALTEKGLAFSLNSTVTEIGENYVAFVREGKPEITECSKVLLSAGRVPSVEGLGLENIGVELAGRSIKTDERLRTNVPGVYAAGDVNGVSMLAHTAYREAAVAVNNMLGKRDIMRYNAVPSVIYTDPEAAWVGETEESARIKGMDIETITIPMAYSGRYMAENEDVGGICKILVDKRFRKIAGVHMLGNYSSEIIYGAALMMETELRPEDIEQLVFPHPTVSEIIRDGIFMMP